MLNISRTTLNTLFHEGKIQGKQLTPGGKQLYLINDEGVAVPPVVRPSSDSSPSTDPASLRSTPAVEVISPEDTDYLMMRCLALTGKALSQLENLAQQKPLDSYEVATLEKLTKIVLTIRLDAREDAKVPKDLMNLDLKALTEKAKQLLLEEGK
jgi:hypothetical protein